MAFIKSRADAEAWHVKNEANTPRAGESAPDFELSDVQGTSSIRLSDFAAKKPVALVFGSFT